MRKFLYLIAVLAVVGVASTSHAAGGKYVRTVQDIDWLRTNAASQTRNGSAYDSRRNIGQSTADTTQWFPIPGVTWGPGVDLYAQVRNSSATAPTLGTLFAAADTAGVFAWVHLTADTLASAMTACSVYVETAAPNAYKTVFSEADGAGKHRWLGATFNPTDNLPSYTFAFNGSEAGHIQAPWTKGHTQARLIFVPVGNFRRAQAGFSYWANDK